MIQFLQLQNNHINILIKIKKFIFFNHSNGIAFIRGGIFFLQVGNSIYVLLETADRFTVALFWNIFLNFYTLHYQKSSRKLYYHCFLNLNARYFDARHEMTCEKH